jgi:hypothetical protein
MYTDINEFLNNLTIEDLNELYNNGFYHVVEDGQIKDWGVEK